ncbi:MAG: hypothetical protein JO034_04535 [Singulisphaera sp.]|nr:hypothetical protein [Singulisphaera sp.]
MRRIEAVRSLRVVLACAATTAVAEEPLALTAPALSAPSEPTGELPPAIEARPGPDPGSVLAVPGIPIPGRAAAARPRLPVADPTAPAVSDRPPALIGPVEMSAPPPARPMAPGQPRPPARLNRPLVLESVPAPGLPGPSPATNRDPRRPDPGPRATSPTTDPLPNRRPSGFLGRLLSPPPPTHSERQTLERDGAAAEESRPDPAADAAMKRRVEHQVREAVGDRVRFVEVRVSGRHVSISARPARFWQRRGVRRALESLPGLDGYRTTVEVLD